jgi:hypothetical protein
MSENLQLSKEVYARLEDVAKRIESVTGKKPSIDQVVLTLIDVYSKGPTIEAGRIDMIIDIWDKVQNLEKRVAKLEESRGQTAAQLQTVAKHEVVAQAQPVRQPVVVTPKPVVQQAMTERAAAPTQDKFMEFMQSVVVYPMDKLRKSREQIDKMVKEGTFEVMSVGGQEILIYKPMLQEFIKKLPIPIADKQKLSQKERRLLETLSSAGLVFEDAVTGNIREA